MDNLYKQFKKRFEKMPDDELINTLKKDLKKPGWVTARAIFLIALKNELKKRNLKS